MLRQLYPRPADSRRCPVLNSSSCATAPLNYFSCATEHARSMFSPAAAPVSLQTMNHHSARLRRHLVVLLPRRTRTIQSREQPHNEPATFPHCPNDYPRPRGGKSRQSPDGQMTVVSLRRRRFLFASLHDYAPADDQQCRASAPSAVSVLTGRFASPAEHMMKNAMSTS